MFRLAVSFTLALGFVISPTMAAQEKPSTIVQVNREIGISFAPSLIAYREYDNNGNELDSEHGWIPGAGARASVQFDALNIKNLLSNVTYQYNNGSSKHASQNLDGPGALHYQAPFTSNDVLVGLGWSWDATKVSLAPEVAFEYRRWFRGLPEAKLSIKETYTFWAPGGALRASINPIPPLVLKARAGIAHTLFPQNAGVGNPNGNVPNVTMALGSRIVWQADLGADYAISRRIHAFAEIAYSHFNFGRSQNYYYNGGHSYEYEPNSTTDLAKVNVGVACAF